MERAKRDVERLLEGRDFTSMYEANEFLEAELERRDGQQVPARTSREEAEDLAQEAFLRLHRSLPGFRGDSRVSTWLYRATTRLAIDQLRRERIKRRLFFFRQDNDAPDPVELAGDSRPDPGREFQSQEAMRLLRKSLDKLSPRQQVIFNLRHYEGLPLKEIAAHLDLETGTVKAHLHRAVTQLRQDLAEYREE